MDKKECDKIGIWESEKLSENGYKERYTKGLEN